MVLPRFAEKRITLDAEVIESFEDLMVAYSVQFCCPLRQEMQDVPFVSPPHDTISRPLLMRERVWPHLSESENEDN